MSMSSPLNRLGSIWYHLETSHVPYSPNQFLGWDFFCCFLQKTGSRTPLRHFEIFNHYKKFRVSLNCKRTGNSMSMLKLKSFFIPEQDLKPEFRLKVAEWEVRKALAGTSKKNVDEIRQLMPDDFNKKLSEWELIKQNPSVPANTG